MTTLAFTLNPQVLFPFWEYLFFTKINMHFPILFSFFYRSLFGIKLCIKFSLIKLKPSTLNWVFVYWAGTKFVLFRRNSTQAVCAQTVHKRCTKYLCKVLCLHKRSLCTIFYSQAKFVQELCSGKNIVQVAQPLLAPEQGLLPEPCSGAHPYRALPCLALPCLDLPCPEGARRGKKGQEGVRRGQRLQELGEHNVCAIQCSSCLLAQTLHKLCTVCAHFVLHAGALLLYNQSSCTNEVPVCLHEPPVA